MKSKKLWLVILVLVFGMSVSSAFGQDTALNGKWKARARVGEYPDDIVEYTFLAGNYEILKEMGPNRHSPYEKGTYTTNDKGEISLKPTHFYFDLFNDSGWGSKDVLNSKGWTDVYIERMFSDRTFVYSIILGSTTLELYQGSRKFTYFKL